MGASENTILIGHSSGAVAAMRYAENNRVLGSVLVSGYYTDLNTASERASGYFDQPWDWKKIRSHQSWIIQFSSVDDPLIPIEEPRALHRFLNTEYYEFTDQGHFGYGKPKPEFPELVAAIKAKI
jgi:predicted alpha/beta hydrolase family esterase